MNRVHSTFHAIVYLFNIFSDFRLQMLFGEEKNCHNEGRRENGKIWKKSSGSQEEARGPQARTLVKLFTLPSKGYFELEPVHLH